MEQPGRARPVGNSSPGRWRESSLRLWNWTPLKDTINRTIAEVFDRAGIPLSFLTGTFFPGPNGAGTIWWESITAGRGTPSRRI